MVYSGPNSQGITVVASKFFVASFLCMCFKEIVPDLKVKISDNPYPMRAHSLQFALLEGQPFLN